MKLSIAAGSLVRRNARSISYTFGPRSFKVSRSASVG